MPRRADVAGGSFRRTATTRGFLRRIASASVFGVPLTSSTVALAATGTELAAAAPTASPSWADGRPRVFGAGTAAIGALARAQAMAGYGKPHWTWGGAEVDGVSTTEFGSVVPAAHLALLLVDVRVGYRWTWSYVRGFPLRRDRDESSDLGGKPRAHYRGPEFEVSGLVPAPLGFAQWDFEAHRAGGVTAGHDVYEEWLRAVTRPGWATATRIGYSALFADERGSAGVLAEWVTLGGRGSVQRIGPLVTWEFSPAFDVALLLTVVIRSPDALDFYDGSWGTLRLRYRFST